MANEKVVDELRLNKDLLLLKSPTEFLIAETWMLDLLNENGHRLWIRR